MKNIEQLTGQENGVSPEKLIDLLQKYPGTAITGSVSFYLQTGMPLDVALNKANDIDIFVGDVDEQTLHGLYASCDKLGGNSDKKINAFSQQERFAHKTGLKDLVSFPTEYGSILLVSIGSMAMIDLEREKMIVGDKDYEPEKFAKYIKKIERYIPYVDEELSKKLRETLGRIS